MRTEPTTHVIEDYIDAMVKRGDFGKFFSDNVEVVVVGTPQVAKGREEVVSTIIAMHGRAFDAEPQIRGLLAGDRNLLLEAEFIGIHRGTLNGIEATGRQVRVPYAVVYDLAGDKITALRIYRLAQGLMEQLTS